MNNCSLTILPQKGLDFPTSLLKLPVSQKLDPVNLASHDVTTSLPRCTLLLQEGKGGENYVIPKCVCACVCVCVCVCACFYHRPRSMLKRQSYPVNPPCNAVKIVVTCRLTAQHLSLGRIVWACVDTFSVHQSCRFSINELVPGPLWSPVMVSPRNCPVTSCEVQFASNDYISRQKGIWWQEVHMK